MNYNLKYYISIIPIEEKVKEKKDAVIENKFLKREIERMRDGLEDMRGVCS